MAIIRNTFTENTPYFSSHIPLELKGDEVLVTLISDMVSYSLLPSDSATIINQPFGAENYYNFTITIVNLTKNVDLQIELLTEELLQIFSETNFILRPAQTRNILVGIDPDRFNAIGSEAQIDDLLQLKVINLDNGTYALRNLSIELVSQTRLPNEINIE